jgi:hypothetical protein
MLQKRDAPELFKLARKGELAPVYRWTVKEEKIVAGVDLGAVSNSSDADAFARSVVERKKDIGNPSTSSG